MAYREVYFRIDSAYQLITADTKDGPGIRTATAKERKSQKAG